MSQTPNLPAAAEGMMRELRRLRDTNPKAWDALVDAGLCNAWDALKAAIAAPDPVRESLQAFGRALHMNREKLHLSWSFGYWEGFDPGLVLVNGKEEPHLENTRFRAVLKLDDDIIREALASLEPKKEEKPA